MRAVATLRAIRAGRGEPVEEAHKKKARPEGLAPCVGLALLSYQVVNLLDALSLVESGHIEPNPLAMLDDLHIPDGSLILHVLAGKKVC
jgi:hypothetical protein